MAAVVAEYGIADSGGVELLASAAAALDRAEACRTAIDKDGECIKGKAGWRDHPLLKRELANRAFVTAKDWQANRPRLLAIWRGRTSDPNAGTSGFASTAFPGHAGPRGTSRLAGLS